MEEQLKILVSVLDAAVDPGDCSDYDLFIEMDRRTFSYAVLDHILNKFLALESFRIPDHDKSAEALLEEVRELRPFLKGTFHAVKVLFCSGRFTLVPGQLFNPSEAGSYLWFNLPADPDESVHFNRMDYPGIISVFGVPSGALDAIRKFFPSFDLFHQSSVLIESLWALYKNRIQDTRIFINGRETEFDLLVFDTRSLRYCNSFPVKTPEDLVYYLIFVMEQLNLNPENTVVMISGDIVKDAPVHRLLLKYIRHVDFTGRNDSFEYGFDFGKIPPHSHATMLNLGLCGS